MSSLLAALNQKIFHWINQDLANPVFDAVLPIFNHGATFFPLLLVLFSVLIYTNSRRLWIFVFLLTASLTLGDALIFNPLKKAISASRPAATIQNVRTLASGAKSGQSFPSSHTANMFAAAVMISVFFPRARKAAYAVAVTVGFSRVYVGVHYPGDVLGSALLGLAYAKIFLWGCRKWVPSMIDPRAESSPNIPFKAWSLSSQQTFTIALGGLILLQGVRLIWAWQTSLDVPPGSLDLWRTTLSFNQTTGIKALFAKGWFGIFGTSPFSFWLIPWTFQTAWILSLAFPIIRKRQAREILILLLLVALVPLISQLSFLGSPAQIFADSEWVGKPWKSAALFYFVLGLPLWITALLFLRTRHS